jgi:hypothetical protein
VSARGHIDLRVGFFLECGEKGYPPSPTLPTYTHTNTISVVVAGMIVVMEG